MGTHVEHPNRRMDLIGSLEDLSDFEMQKREWCNPKFNLSAPHVFSDNMRFPREYLLDDYSFHLWEAGEDCLGYILANEKEGYLIKKVAVLLKKVEYDKPNSYYLTSPLWQEVVQAAKEAYDYIMTYEDMDDLLLQCRED